MLTEHLFENLQAFHLYDVLLVSNGTITKEKSDLFYMNILL